MSKHTPGPWKMRRTSDGKRYQIAPEAVKSDIDRELIVYGGIYHKADARLIAAAPDLLSALTAMIEEWDRHGCCDSRGVVDIARKAVAKTEAGS